MFCWKGLHSPHHSGPLQGCFRYLNAFLSLQASVRTEHCLTTLLWSHSCLLGDDITVQASGLGHDHTDM